MAISDIMQEEAQVLLTALTQMVAAVALAKQNNAASAAAEAAADAAAEAAADAAAVVDIVQVMRAALNSTTELPTWATAMLTDAMLTNLALPVEHAAEGLIATLMTVKAAATPEATA